MPGSQPADETPLPWHPPRTAPVWWHLPDIFDSVVVYLSPPVLSGIATVHSSWADGVDRTLGKHQAAGQALKQWVDCGHEALTAYIEGFEGVMVGMEMERGVAGLTLRLYSSRIATIYCELQASLLQVLASGENCDGLAEIVEKIALARRGICSALLTFARRRLGEFQRLSETHRQDLAAVRAVI